MRDPDLLDRITIDPELIVGKPTIRGFRITVEQILRASANGVPTDELLDDYPELEPDDIRAALYYASEIVRNERVYRIPVGAWQ